MSETLGFADCFFCKEDLEPNYKEPEILQRFLSSNKEVQSIRKTGCCSKHQVQLKKQVKFAKEIALL